MRLFAILAIATIPVVAYASTGGDSGPVSLALESVIAAMQVYLTSKLPMLDKRLTKVESEIHNFFSGVVR